MIDVDIIIKFPSRSRPEKMIAHLNNIRATIGIESYLVYLIIDDNDPSITDEVHYSILQQGRFMNMRVSWQKSFSKIDAINRRVPDDIRWKYMVVTSDDMHFTRDYWGEIILGAFKYTSKGCLHFPDGHNNNLITLPVINKRFHDRFGYVYNPAYFSVFCDNEMTEVSQITKEYYFVPVDIVEHRHYRWGFGQPDSQNIFQDGPIMYSKDSKTFFDRKIINFGL
jgi:hypothetical protein